MLPGERRLTLREEAQMLAGYCTQQRAEYLREVELTPDRGAKEAAMLRALVADLLCRGPACCST